ncbi:DUF1365 domain-containing protein [Patulibacter sp.]|uniref:DUF1365 domain-containing protein n=1 Tax=Patulibacter sp. TaxID=1912859 RepID=UPI0027172321|nr:DUF1365 domain-containing protein [Patulibacter sp.]MDO9408440.1 DUF1365 domain-containing protein [Patulibacter sp.]
MSAVPQAVAPSPAPERGAAAGPVPPAPTAGSAVYLGDVRHRRHAPREHAFAYPTAMLLLDLDELPGSLDRHRGWGVERRAPLSFRRVDHHGDPAVPLAEAVRRTVEERTGRRPPGPVRLLTKPRILGRDFNPVTFAYCYAADGTTLQAVLAEVTNTPWGETHAYVVDVDDAERHAPAAVGPVRAGRLGEQLTWELDKVFHVSPFMAMDHRYRWRLSVPDERLVVHLESHRGGERVFDATLTLRRRALDAAGLRAFVRRQPLGTIADVTRIYGHALALAVKRVPHFPHPDR